MSEEGLVKWRLSLEDKERDAWWEERRRGKAEGLDTRKSYYAADAVVRKMQGTKET